MVTVDPVAQWRQMFDETARLMRDHFWVEDMAGVDWAAETARYRPLVDRVGSHDDLLDVLWELHGELGTSHAYVIGGRAGGDPTGRPGLLGADLEPEPGGGPGWRVRRVLPPETSAPAARSPLSGPGVDVRAGDVLLEVNGRPLDPHWGPAPLLVATAGSTVELTVRSGLDRPTRAPSAAWRCARCTPRTSCATGTGWPGCAPRSPSGPRGGWATCTCRT